MGAWRAQRTNLARLQPCFYLRLYPGHAARAKHPAFGKLPLLFKVEDVPVGVGHTLQQRLAPDVTDRLGGGHSDAPKEKAPTGGAWWGRVERICWSSGW